MVSGKIWTSCSIKLKNKSYQYGPIDNMEEKLKSESIENISKILKLVPLLLRGGALGCVVAGVCWPISRITHPSTPLKRGIAPPGLFFIVFQSLNTLLHLIPVHLSANITFIINSFHNYPATACTIGIIIFK